LTVIAPSGMGIISAAIGFPHSICKKCYAPDCSECKVRVTPLKSSFEHPSCSVCKTPGCLQCRLFQKLEPFERCACCGEPTCDDCPLFPLMSKEHQKKALNRWNPQKPTKSKKK
jgi:hypothetical protein